MSNASLMLQIQQDQQQQQQHHQCHQQQLQAVKFDQYISV